MAQCLASIFTASGSTGAGITEHTSIRGRGANAQWRGMNGKWNRIGWGGNQWTGGRNAIVAAGRRAQVAGRAFGGVGIAMSGVQAFHSARQGDWNAVAGHRLDAAMVGVGFAGAVGFGVSLAYFGVSYFAGCAG